MRRGGRSAALSIATIAVAFLALGGFLLVSDNIRSAIDAWTMAAEMSVYLHDDIDAEARDALVADISAHPAVAAVELVSKDEALARFTRDFPELADVTTEPDHPLPASLEIRLKSPGAPDDSVAGLASDLTARAGVADVRYDAQWLARLRAIAGALRFGGAIVATVLVLGAAFTITAVVRLSLDARSDELDIMQLVGAPYAYIRGPAIAQGALLGSIGAGVSLLLLWALFRSIRPQIALVASGLGTSGAIGFLSLPSAMLILAGGLLVGACAGMVASRFRR